MVFLVTPHGSVGSVATLVVALIRDFQPSYLCAPQVACVNLMPLDVLTLRVECSLTLKIRHLISKYPDSFGQRTRPGFVAEILWTLQEFFQPWPFWTKLWVDSGRLFISVVVYTLKVCLALTPLLGMAWTHSLKPDEDEPQSESREDIEKLSMLESRFCSNQSVIPWRDLSKPGMSQFRRKSVARMFSGHPSGSGVQSPRVNCSLKVTMCLKFSHGCFVQSFVGFQNSWNINIRIWRYFRSLICLQIVL